MMFRLTTLKQKLYAIVFASLIARIIGFFLLPNTYSPLGPDEGTYGAVAAWTEQGLPAKDFPLFGEGLYLSARAFIWPATLFNQLGIDPVHSVRLTATIYGLLSLVLVVFVFLKTVDSRADLTVFVERRTTLILTIFAVFAFLPSHFIWSLLGLRESAAEFWTLSAFATLYWIFHLHKRLSFEASIFLVASIVFVFSARSQVGWVIVITFLIYLLINIRKRIALSLIPIVLISFLLGITVTTVTTGTTGTTGTTASSGAKILNSLKTAAELTTYKHQVNQLDAASVITTQSCPAEKLGNDQRARFLGYLSNPPSSFDTYFCILWRAPYMAATFLFRPIIGIDTTSTSSLFAASENIAWLGVFIFILVMLIKKRRLAFIGPLAPSLIFFTLYCVGAGSYEGNMGTAFRHKSLILWVILLLVASVITAEKKSNSGNERA